MEPTAYSILSDVDHVLTRPVTYLGPIEPVTAVTWALTGGKAVQRTTTYYPALEQLLLETSTNAVDDIQRALERGVSRERLKMAVKLTNTEVSIYNESLGIPIARHEVSGLWTPDLIFFHLRTSSNYNDNDQRSWAGSNGLGVKLVAIFSTEFRVEVTDPQRKLRYVQCARRNMKEVDQPTITPYDGDKASCCVTFTPDLARFKLTTIPQDMIEMFEWTMAGASWCLGGVPVIFNDREMNMDLCNYTRLFSVPATDNQIVFRNDKVELLFIDSPEQGFQVSFVNNMYCRKNGEHVNELLKTFTAHVLEKLNAKKKLFSIKDVKKHVTLIVRCTVANPMFKTQAKDEFMSPVPKISIPESFLKKTAKWNFVRQMSLYGDIKSKDLPTIPKNKPFIYDKLIGATLMNTDAPCVLILVEGDSAVQAATYYRSYMPGGTDLYSIFPIKGKMLNVRNADAKQIMENPELIAVRHILNISSNLDYSKPEAFKTLTHKGGVLYMTDADVDGDHISGLGQNLFGFAYPSLANRDYVMGMLTPLLVARRPQELRFFYTHTDFEKWTSTLAPDAIAQTDKPKSGQWTVKYYKGLGSWDKEDFHDPTIMGSFKEVVYRYDQQGYDRLTLLFDKNRADDRKGWVSQLNIPSPTYQPEDNVVVETVADFVDTRLIHFSRKSNERGIPSAIDGLKPAQRKIIYAMFKKKLTVASHIKVSQFMGYVAEQTAYEHGEENLGSTIMKLAQDHPGANNIPLVKGKGGYGSRIKNGDDMSSTRYVHMGAGPLNHILFRKEDEPLLRYLDCDGSVVEPAHYIPIIPIIAVNGAQGMGTGFSTDAPTYHPTNTITPWLRAWLRNNYPLPTEEGTVEYPNLVPWYHGFQGTVTPKGTNTFITEGKFYEIGRNSYRITELPIGVSINKYYSQLDTWIKGGQISTAERKCNGEKIDITITGLSLAPTAKNLKLQSTISTSNLTFFDAEGRIVQYETMAAVLEDFCLYRYQAYVKRKELQLAALAADVAEEERKIRYLTAVINGQIDLRVAGVVEILAAQGFPEEYLDLKQRSLSPAGLTWHQQKVVRLQDKIAELIKISERTIWEQELREFEQAYRKEYGGKGKFVLKL